MSLWGIRPSFSSLWTARDTKTASRNATESETRNLAITAKTSWSFALVSLTYSTNCTPIPSSSNMKVNVHMEAKFQYILLQLYKHHLTLPYAAVVCSMTKFSKLLSDYFYMRNMLIITCFPNYYWCKVLQHTFYIKFTTYGIICCALKGVLAW